MVQKILGILLTLALVCCLVGGALAETTFEGTVVAGSTEIFAAPFGGVIDSFNLRAGSVIHKGDLIARVATTSVYAPSAGTVTAVFAKPGDNMEDVVARYGADLYLSPVNKYQIAADIEKAYNQTENKYVNVGEKVFVACVGSGVKHNAEGLITAVDGTGFTVKTTSGELMVDEDVRVYRDGALSAQSRIGGGTVTRVGDVAVNGTGSLMTLHVKEGDAVERGQLLMETVAGGLDGLYATTNEFRSSLDGVVASASVQAGSSVNKGDAVLTVYPQNTLLIEMAVSEYDLGSVAEGGKVTFTLNYQESDAGEACEGVVETISYLGTEQNGEVSYLAYVAFQSNEDIRLGMTATVTVP